MENLCRQLKVTDWRIPMIITDCHVHSCFSSDSETPVEAMIEQAMKRNFAYFYLTDHMDYEFPVYEEGLDFLFDPEEYFAVLNLLKEKYSGAGNRQDQTIHSGKIEIRPSIELGLKPHLGGAYRKLLKDYPFDFVIGSTHLVDDLDPYNQIFWERRSEKQALESYFETIIKNIQAFPEFDSCGHLDYAIRYAPSVNYRYMDYADYLDEALKLLIHHGIALEINTAGYAKGLGQPNPQPQVLKRYKELGGELLTIGSDGHTPGAYAYGFEQAEALLKGIGFRYYTVFKQRKPEMIKF